MKKTDSQQAGDPYSFRNTFWMNEKESHAHKSTYIQVGVQCFNESEVLNQSSVLLVKFCAENLHLRVTKKT